MDYSQPFMDGWMSGSESAIARGQLGVARSAHLSRIDFSSGFIVSGILRFSFSLTGIARCAFCGTRWKIRVIARPALTTDQATQFTTLYRFVCHLPPFLRRCCTDKIPIAASFEIWRLTFDRETPILRDRYISLGQQYLAPVGLRFDCLRLR